MVTFDKLLGRPLLHKHIEADIGGPYVNIAGDTMTGGLVIGVADTVNQVGLEIDQNDTTNNPMAVYVKTISSGEAFRFEQNAPLGASKTAFAIYSNQAHVNVDSYLFKFENLNVSSTIPMSKWVNNGSGRMLELFQVSNADTINIDQDGDNSSDIVGIRVNVTNTGAGDAVAAKFETGKLDMSLNEIKNLRTEQQGSLPGAGTTGRLIYLTTDSHLYLDQG